MFRLSILLLIIIYHVVFIYQLNADLSLPYQIKLIYNLMLVAEEQGKQVDASKIEKRLSIPVIPFVAEDKKNYDLFYKANGKPVVN